MCGHQYDPSENAQCPTCPLNKNCQLICCPVCGYETVDVNRSGILRFITKLFDHQQAGKGADPKFNDSRDSMDK